MHREFHCPLWGSCPCPDGAVRHECPALRAAMELPEPSVIDRIINYLFDPDRTLRTCAFVLPICVAVGCLMARVMP